MATPADDYIEQSFFFPEYITACAPLDARSALEYFSFSPWYRTEPPSNNQILRMQNTGIDVTGVDEAEELKKFTGIEFAIVHAQAPSLFIIQKRERFSPNEVRPMEAYYVINNRIQQSPDVYSLIANRLNASLHNIMAGMTALRTHRPTYTPTKGHVWPIAFDPTSAFVSGGSSKKHQIHSVNATAPGTPMPMDVDGAGGVDGKTDEDALNASGSATAKKQMEITMPLLHAIRTTAAHTNVVSPIAGSNVSVTATSTATSTSTPISPKRVVKSAMALERTHRAAALAQKEREAEAAFTFAGPGGVFGSSMAAELMMRRGSSPGTGGTGTSSRPNSRGNTPKAEGKKKKKKEKGANSPAVQSPAVHTS